jgi:low temperature requirement protein LtrA
MKARSIHEPHRTATPLELLFDLTFVVAVAALTSQFAHAIEDGHALGTLVPFLQVFFAIWWAWMNHTWFASSFDTDDVPFRLLTLVQMTGVVVLAAGVPAALTDSAYGTVTVGYLIMRAGLVSQWLRAAHEDRSSRGTALRYAGGIAAAESGWLLRQWLDDAGALADGALPAVFAALVVAELTIPVWAERARPTSWHPHHIAERYGLFAIILLGESVLAASTGVRRAAGDGLDLPHVSMGVAALALVFALWWLYFLQPAGTGLASNRDRSFAWGYGHYGLFAALALVGAGLEAAVAQPGTPEPAVAYSVAGPTAVFLVLLWVLDRPIVARPVLQPGVMLGGAAAVLLVPVPLLVVSPAVSVAALALVCGVLIAATMRSAPSLASKRRSGPTWPARTL